MDTALATATPTIFAAEVIPASRRAIHHSIPTTGIRRKKAAGNASMSMGTPAFAKITGVRML
jgi:hypothetical protein